MIASINIAQYILCPISVACSAYLISLSKRLQLSLPVKHLALTSMMYSALVVVYALTLDFAEICSLHDLSRNRNGHFLHLVLAKSHT